MDKQFGLAVILVLGGFGITQLEQDGDGSFLVGIGIGTIVIASFWIVLRIIKDLKRK